MATAPAAMLGAPPYVEVRTLLWACAFVLAVVVAALQH
jgi:hypothetical protein